MTSSLIHVLQHMPRLCAQTSDVEHIARVRFFAGSPVHSEWYGVEFDGVDTLWGLIDCAGSPPIHFGNFRFLDSEQHDRCDDAKVGVVEFYPHEVHVVQWDDSFEPTPMSRLYGGIRYSRRNEAKRRGIGRWLLRFGGRGR